MVTSCFEGRFLVLVVLCMVMYSEATVPGFSKPACLVISVEHIDESLSSVPPGMRTDATRINLYKNAITAIGSGEFSAFTDLLCLRLSVNWISFIPNDAFTGTPLEYLDLKANDISGSFPDFCAVGGTLESLRLSSNPITVIPAGTLSCLTTLKSFSLSYSDITAFPDFQNLPNPGLLEYLDVGSNPGIAQPVPLPLTGLTGLVTISLHNMGWTAISDLSLLPTNNQLTFITIIENPFSTITNASIAALQALTSSFYIQLTPSDFIAEALSIADPDKLSHLALQCDASQASIPLPNLSSITQLTILGPSMLTEFPDVSIYNKTLFYLRASFHANLNPDPRRLAEILSTLTQLTHLILNDNGFTTLPDLTVISSWSISLYVEGNPLICDCDLAWVIGSGNTATVANYLYMYAVRPGNIVELADNPECSSPPALTGTRLSALQMSDLTCAMTTDTETSIDTGTDKSTNTETPMELHTDSVTPGSILQQLPNKTHKYYTKGNMCAALVRQPLPAVLIGIPLSDVAEYVDIVSCMHLQLATATRAGVFYCPDHGYCYIEDNQGGNINQLCSNWSFYKIV